MSGRFLVFSEFLSTTYDIKTAKRFLNQGELKDDLVRVLFTLYIKKEIADQNPNLFCFKEEISYYLHEKALLISSSTIFQIQQVKKLQSVEHYEFNLHFISNGYNKYDFIKYTTLNTIDLRFNQIGDEGARQ